MATLPLVGYQGLAGYDARTGVDRLNAFLDTTFRQTEANAFGKDSMRAFFLMSDLPNRVRTLNNIIVNLIVNELHPLLIQVLPLTPTTDLEFQNTVIRYEQALLEHRPEQAPGRMLREKQTTNRGKMQRYGRSAFFTVDVANTKEGRVQIAQKMVQFVTLASKTFSHMGLQTLLMGRDFTLNGHFQKTYASQYVYLEDIRNEIDTFCLPNKQMNGLMQLTTSGTRVIEHRIGKPATHFILQPVKADALMKNNPIYTHQYLAGNDGPEQFKSAIKSVKSINGITLMEAPDYVKTSQMSQLSMQERATVGRYEPVGYTELQGVATNMPTTYIFDINISDYVPVTLADVFVASKRFRRVDNTDLYEFDHAALRANVPGVNNHIQTDTPPDPFVEWDGGNWALLKWLFKAEDPTKLRQLNIDEWLTLEVPGLNKAGEYKLFGGLLFRPFDSYITDTGIVVRGGSELGLVGHSPDLVEMGKNVANGTQILEYSLFAGGFVANWDLVHIIPNVFYSKILYGGGHRFLDPQGNKQLFNRALKMNHPDHPCMYGILFPRSKVVSGINTPLVNDHSSVMFLKGKCPVGNQSARQEESYPGSEFCSKLWMWSEVSDLNNQRDAMGIATYLCPGSYKIMHSNGMFTHVAGRTHHGPKEDIGSAEIRNKGLSFVQ